MIDPKTVMFEEGRRQALDLQTRAPEMTGTEIIAEEGQVPAFDPQRITPAGLRAGQWLTRARSGC